MKTEDYMPYINDFNDSIDITEEQRSALASLAWRKYVEGMIRTVDNDRYLADQLNIVPNSTGYQLCIPRPENKMYKIVELK